MAGDIDVSNFWGPSSSNNHVKRGFGGYEIDTTCELKFFVEFKTDQSITGWDK